MTATVRVDLGGRAYDVRIGEDLLDAAGEHVSPLLKRPRLAVVADAAVADLHGERLRSGLRKAGVDSELITVPPGEGSKSFAELERLCGRLLDLRLERGDMVAAFGGGVVGDLAGFAAAIYKRGVDFIQIPTTLLAQVDSSVGGKTAIDTPQGKNLIGAFHQPRLVLADTAVLATLPPRELRAGLAEVIKAALIEDPAFFAELERDAPAVLRLKPGPLARAVTRSIEIKAAIVAEDEHETTGRRALLNLGHTFGHALEAEVGFPPPRAGERDRPSAPGLTRGVEGAHGAALLHGEAVALGCAMALRFSAAQGFCDPADVRRLEALLASAGLPARLEALAAGPFGASALLDRMAQDKKNQSGALTLILSRGIGRAFLARDVPAAAVRDFLITEGASP